MEIKGKVLEVSETLEIKEGFKKRELILEYIENNPQYAEYIKIEAIQERCALLDSVHVGDEVEVSFNLRGRAWTDKTGKKSYFNSLQMWRITPLAGAGAGTSTVDGAGASAGSAGQSASAGQGAGSTSQVASTGQSGSTGQTAPGYTSSSTSDQHGTVAGGTAPKQSDFELSEEDADDLPF